MRDGTWVLLEDVGGRLLAAPVLPATLLCIRLDFSVAAEEGRDGGSPGSPTGPVKPCTLPSKLVGCRLGDAPVGAPASPSPSLASSPSSSAISVIRDETILGARAAEPGRLVMSTGFGKEEEVSAELRTEPRGGGLVIVVVE